MCTSVVFEDVEVVVGWVVEEKVNFRLSDFVDMFVPPLWTLILVHKQSSNSLKEFSVVHETLRHLELHLKHIVYVHLGAAFDLLENDGHGKRATLCKHLFSFLCKLTV